MQQLTVVYLVHTSPICIVTLLQVIILGFPVTTVETVTIIKIDFQASTDKTLIQGAVDFLEKYNFTSKHKKVFQENGMPCLKTTYSKYYPSIYIDADKYDLITVISEGSWYSAKQAFISLVKHATNNSLNSVTGKLWSAEPVPPNPDAVEEYTPVRVPLLGFAFHVNNCRNCDDVPQECGLVDH